MLVAWLVCLWDVARFVAHYGSAMPAMDDLELPALVDLPWPEYLQASWQPANEHRMFAPYFLMRVLLSVFGDFRAPLVLVLVAYALAALVLLGLARALRGRSEPFDAVFVLLLLHMGNAENLLLGCQLGTAMPLLLVGLWLLAVLRQGPVGAGRAACIVVLLVLLPLHGSWGLAQALALAPATLVLAACARGPSADDRKSARRLLIAGALGLLAIGAYFIDYQPSNRVAGTRELARVAPIAAQVLSLNLGPGQPANSPASGWAAFALALTGLGWCAFALRRREQRTRALALGAALWGGFAIALAIGWGRQDQGSLGGYSLRYCTATAWAAAAALLAWIAFAPRVLSVLVCAVWLGWMLSAHASAREVGHQFGQMHRRRTQGLAADAAAGLPLLALAERWHGDFYPAALTESPQAALYERLRELWRVGLPPFDSRVDPQPALSFEEQRAFAPLGLEVVWVSSPAPPEVSATAEQRAIALAGPSELCLRLPSAWRGVALACGGPLPLSVALEVRAADGAVLARAEQTVDARVGPAAHAFELRFDRAPALLVLRAESAEPPAQAHVVWQSIRRL